MHTNILGSRWDGDNRYSFENQKKTRQDRICESKRDKDILPSLTFYPHIHLKKKKKNGCIFFTLSLLLKLTLHLWLYPI